MDIVHHLRGLGRIFPEYASTSKLVADACEAMQARIKDLEAQLEAVGAGGVQAMRQPAMQDDALLPALKELAALDFGACHSYTCADEVRLQKAAMTVRAYIASKE